eukprot:TRINITY_DN15094_c0_g1_i1.p1 TRINITY_DN15094_c0_g1~~TRINITY_DN15094_c0_g1_i1.p1  ORF type:complete len:428 (+),score=29.43 TRINITY_DN15094_c0_g1_i1:256-1539(+)
MMASKHRGALCRAVPSLAFSCIASPEWVLLSTNTFSKEERHLSCLTTAKQSSTDSPSTSPHKGSLHYSVSVIKQSNLPRPLQFGHSSLSSPSLLPTFSSLRTENQSSSSSSLSHFACASSSPSAARQFHSYNASREWPWARIGIQPPYRKEQTAGNSSQTSTHRDGPNKTPGEKADVKHETEISALDAGRGQEGPASTDFVEGEVGPETVTTKSGDDKPETVRTVIDIKSRDSLLWQRLSSVRAQALVWLYTSQIERSFDLDAFLEEARRAYTIVTETCWRGDMEALGAMVAPNVLQKYKELYAQLYLGPKEKGLRVEFTVNKVDDARLDGVAISQETTKPSPFNLSSMAQADLKGYYSDLWGVFVVKLMRKSTRRTFRSEDDHCLLEISEELPVTVYFARQMPSIPNWNSPLEELESKWVIAAVQE